MVELSRYRPKNPATDKIGLDPIASAATAFFAGPIANH
jgi:hypothetical protein